jgi:hypothetical protein
MIVVYRLTNAKMPDKIANNPLKQPIVTSDISYKGSIDFRCRIQLIYLQTNFLSPILKVKIV